MDPAARRTVVDMLRWRADHEGERRAFTYLNDGEEDATILTYADLDQRVRAVAAVLAQLDAVGERVLLLFPPEMDFLVAFLGCLYAGVTPVPTYPPDPFRLERSLPRFRAIAADARVRYIVSNVNVRAMAQGMLILAPELESLQWVELDGIGPEWADDWSRPSEITPEKTAFLQYTSGSTSSPRGVQVTHANLDANERETAHAMRTGEDNVLLSWLPQFHDMGLIAMSINPIYIGCQAVLMPPTAFLQRPLRWLKAISRFGGTHSGGPNFSYALCARKVQPEDIEALDLSTWRFAFCGAEPVYSDTLESFAKTFAPAGFRLEAMHPCYGLAESSLFVTGGSAEDEAPTVRSFYRQALEKEHRAVVVDSDENSEAMTLVGCGEPNPQTRVLVVDPEQRTECPAGAVGEIWVQGPCVANGYFQRPAESRETFGAELEGAEGTFLRTGDLGFYLDGELFVTGRLKDLIIIRGRNLYPQDIERVVENASPSVRPGCTAAFALTDGDQETLGVVAEVERRHVDPRHESHRSWKAVRHNVPPDGCDPDESVPFSPEAVAKAIREAVAASFDVRVDAVGLLRARTIPKTSSGKIQRHACRQGFKEGSLNLIEVFR